jgi:hypothetical protein
MEMMAVDLQARMAQPQESPAQNCTEESIEFRRAGGNAGAGGIEPSPEAWEAKLEPLISLPFSQNQNDSSILEFPGGSRRFTGFPIVCTSSHLIAVRFPGHGFDPPTLLMGSEKSPLRLQP